MSKLDAFFGFWKAEDLENINVTLEDGSTTTLLDYIANDWKTTLKSKRAKVAIGHKTAIPDADAYESVVVGRSNAGYKDFIGSHPEADFIMLDREVTMLLAKDEYRSKVDSALAEGGDFEKGIDANVGKFKRNVLSVIAVNGKPPFIHGANEKLALALAGHYGILADIIDDTVDRLTIEEGFTAIPVFDIGLIPSVVAIVVKGGRLTVMAEMAGKGDDYINNKILTKVNNRLGALANRIVADGYTMTLEIVRDATLNRYGVHIAVDEVSGT